MFGDACHEGGLTEGLFDKFIVDFVCQGEHINDFRDELEAGFFSAFECGGIVEVEPVVAHVFFDEVLLGDFAVWGLEVDDFAVFTEGDLAGAKDGVTEVWEEAFDDVFHRGAIAIGFVDFKNGEFGVVCAVDAFVTEVFAEFEDFIEAAHEEAFEVEFGGDAHHHFAVECVVVCDEGFCCGATGLALHDGGFDFNESAGGQVVADAQDDFVTFIKACTALGVGHEVEVATAVAFFLVLEAMEFFWGLTNGLGEEVPGFDFDGFFAGLGCEEFSFDADDVTEVGEFCGVVGVFADAIAFEEDLEGVGAIAEVDEHEFAHAAFGHDAACDGDGFAFFKGFTCFFEVTGAWEGVAIGGIAKGFEFCTVFNTLCAVLIHGGLFGFVCHVEDLLDEIVVHDVFQVLNGEAKFFCEFVGRARSTEVVHGKGDALRTDVAFPAEG